MAAPPGCSCSVPFKAIMLLGSPLHNAGGFQKAKRQETFTKRLAFTRSSASWLYEIIRDPTESHRPFALCPGQVSHPESHRSQVSLSSQQQLQGPLTCDWEVVIALAPQPGHHLRQDRPI